MKIRDRDHFQELVAYLVLFCLLPIGFLSFGIIPFEARHIILVGMSLILVAYAINKKIEPKKLGFRIDNLFGALALNALFSLVMIVAVFLGWFFGIVETVNVTSELWFYFFYVLVSAPLQEFVFRSLMIYEIGQFTRSKWAKVLASAAIYAFAHAMYHNWQVLFITFAAGLIWGYIYLKRPNFWAVAFSHAVVGAVTVFVGLV